MINQRYNYIQGNSHNCDEWNAIVSGDNYLKGIG